MFRARLWAIILLVAGLGLGGLVYYSETAPDDSFWRHPFRLGLDLKGGSHLVYEADVSQLAAAEVDDAMTSLREVIERRINAFGVVEPLVQVEESSLVTSGGHRLIVELPGVTDLEEAIALINVTPTLEFKVLPDELDLETATTTTAADFVATGLSGRYLKRAEVVFDPQGINPAVAVEFDGEGAALFARITRENIERPVGIYLDGLLINAPTVREEIRDGRAEISGQFTLAEAQELARNLNLGALPVPIKLASTETIGATLGAATLRQGIDAGLLGLLIVALFMMFWYRLPGLVAVLSLGLYVVLVLGLFKLFGVTLTAAGIAGLILSFGMALDANILISERLKEELRAGRELGEAIREGFARAWFSIRDSNLSSLISAAVLFWFGTSLIKGFAVTLIIGLIVSLFTSIWVTRRLLLAVVPRRAGRVGRFLFQCGFN